MAGHFVESAPASPTVCEAVTTRVLVSAPFLVPSDNPCPTERKDPPMPTITTKDGVEIFYKDWGSGQPIVFSHGWPLSADDWDTQMLFFLGKGFRVVAHDRRGHGRSTQTGDGHDRSEERRVGKECRRGRAA